MKNGAGRMIDTEDRMKVETNNDIDFQEELRINKYRLDEECLSHATKYNYWAEAYARAKNEYGIAKDNLAYTTADVSLRLRNFYIESGEKYTESRLQSAVDTDRDVIEAKRKLREADDILCKMDVAVKSMDVRKSELDNLVKLYCAGYFSTVSTMANKRDVNDEASRDIRRNLNKERDL